MKHIYGSTPRPRVHWKNPIEIRCATQYINVNFFPRKIVCILYAREKITVARRCVCIYLNDICRRVRFTIEHRNTGQRFSQRYEFTFDRTVCVCRLLCQTIKREWVFIPSALEISIFPLVKFRNRCPNAIRILKTAQFEILRTRCDYSLIALYIFI